MTNWALFLLLSWWILMWLIYNGVRKRSTLSLAFNRVVDGRWRFFFYGYWVVVGGCFQWCQSSGKELLINDSVKWARWKICRSSSSHSDSSTHARFYSMLYVRRWRRTQNPQLKQTTKYYVYCVSLCGYFCSYTKDQEKIIGSQPVKNATKVLPNH